MIPEEYTFWSAKKVKFVFRLSLVIFAACIAAVGIWLWILYHEEAKESRLGVKQRPDPAAAPFNNNPDSTNTAASSLSPLPPEPNSN
jgi:hypothetical protein